VTMFKRTSWSLLLVLLATSAAAQTLDHGVIGCGGNQQSGSGLQLVGTVGQPVIGKSDGDHNQVESGYWYLPPSDLVPVALSTFQVERGSAGAVIHWTLSAAGSGLRIHVWRAVPDGDRVCLTGEPLNGVGSFQFEDRDAPLGELEYWLQASNEQGSETWFGPVLLATTPLRFQLTGNFPNPFNPQTTIAYELTATGPVQLAIHDARGRLVRLLIEATQPAGRHSVTWDGRDQYGRTAASGVYFLRLQADAGIRTDKMLLSR